MEINGSKLEKLERAVRGLYETKSPSRADWADWLYAEHVFIVADYAEDIAKRYDAPVYMCRAAAVLHDVADAKMSRFDPLHEQASMDIARQLLHESGYSDAEIQIIVDDAITLHSCRDGKKPQTGVGKVLSTADARAHLETNYYIYATESMMKNMTEDKKREWAIKKIPRDFYDKIAYEEIRDEVRPSYEKLVAHFKIV